MDVPNDERQLYDRQIRLWGLEGQSRLRNAKILVLEFQSVAVEVVKNLCLAGVGAVTLQSSKPAEQEDLAWNFFLDAASVGQNVAEASAPAIQRLNPRVAVSTETRDVNEVDDALVAAHDVVIITQITDRHKISSLNLAARRSNHAFYYCILSGWGGLLFVDLGAKPHEFIVERNLNDSMGPTSVGPVSGTQEVVSVKSPERESGSTTEKITVRETYCSFDDAISVSTNFARALKVRHRSKVSPYLPAFLALLDGNEKLDVTGIVNKTRQLGLPESILDPDFATRFLSSRGAQLSALAAILGGVLSQEVINYLTLREYPIQNTHIYDGLEGKGPLYHLCKDA